ncbi:hypothetical protein DJ58_4466 [Yersinia frederiksenii ATCC 33641]|uniref:Uncharacterized protein n=1 Tax=Yersinia frederiksenii ATCC 33641 TaxID=349966 RepID=A0ABR4VYA1_YERFR|nr:hypothetical protein DJ58_4466 [Yersinia frederiksenii ATCC 33641]
MSRIKSDIAAQAANRATNVAQRLRVVGSFLAIAPNRDPNAAGGHQAGFFLLEQVRFALALLRGVDGNVFFRPQVNIVIGHHIAAGDRNIFAADIDRTRREHRADCQCLANTVFSTCGGGRCQSFTLTGMIALFIMLFSLGGERDIPARHQLQRTVGLYRAGTEGHVFCCL